MVDLGASSTLQSIFSSSLFSPFVCCFSSFKYRKVSDELVLAHFVVTGLRDERPKNWGPAYGRGRFHPAKFWGRIWRCSMIAGCSCRGVERPGREAEN